MDRRKHLQRHQHVANMYRRTFFTAAVTGVVAAAAGCLSDDEEANEGGGEANESDDGVANESDGEEANDNDKDDISYQRCTEPFVPRGEIPREIRGEVRAAIADGEYAADELAYPDLVGDDTILWETDENRYYIHRVKTDDSTPKLIFEETTPAREDSGSLKMSNQTTDTVEIDVTISTDDEVLVDSALSVDPADDIMEVEAISNVEYAGEEEAAKALPGVEFPDEFRDYEVEVVVETVDDEHVETATIAIHPWFEYYWVQITDDGLLTGSLWENDYAFFSEGPGASKVGIHWECSGPLTGWPQERD